MTLDPKRYQTVTLTLSDGRSGTFTGPVLIEDGDQDGSRVVGIVFVAPRELPPDMYFGPIDEEKEQ